MTFIACYIDVLPVKRKFGFTVIEFRCRFERFGYMTPAAIRNPVIIELTVMYILVAIGAGGWQTYELLLNNAFIPDFEMTIPAGFLCMCAIQFKIGFCMIKTDGTPFIHIMAIFTACLRIVFLVYISFMDIFMAIAALFPDVPEIPFFSFLVTCKTGSCQVSALQPERTLVMLFNSI
jgi:hypothetical protein